MKNKSSKKLGNPATIAAVSTFAANNPKMAKKAANIGLIFTGVVIVGLGGLAFYTLYWKNRFIKLKPDSSQRPSNISHSEAVLRAQKMYEAMRGVGKGYNQVYEALRGLNRNGFIAVYNAFGKKKPATDFLGIGNKNHMTLTEWFADQFSNSQLEKLRFIIDGGGNGLF